MCNKQKLQKPKLHIFKHIFASLGGSLQIFLLFMIFANVLWGMGADRMIFTDCYPLKLIGMSNSTSADEEASVTKAVAGADRKSVV